MKLIFGDGASHFAPYFQNKTEFSVVKTELSRFPNGEGKVWIQESLQNEQVAILQNFSEPVDRNLMQFCFLVDAVKRMNPKKIVGVIPWLGYAKQNQVFREGESLAAQVVGKIISSFPLNLVFLLDIHSQNIKDFFSMAVYELTANDLFVKYLSAMPEFDSKKFMVVSPDKGAVPKNKIVADALKLPLAAINKERNLNSGKVEIKGLNLLSKQAIFGKNLIMFDDMILSGGTVVKDVQFLKSQGAEDIYFFATHLDPTIGTEDRPADQTFVNLQGAPVKKIVVTDSLNFSIPVALGNKIEKISSGNLFVEELLKI